MTTSTRLAPAPGGARPPDLKAVLMRLGNELVIRHGFLPATALVEPGQTRTTWPVREFTEFLNGCPEARAVLAELGFGWSMPAAAPPAIALR